MCIFCSILLVSVAFIISSRIYKKMYPEMKLNSEEVVLIPFRYAWPNPKLRFQFCISIWLCKCIIYHKILFLAIRAIVSSDWSSCLLYSLKVDRQTWQILHIPSHPIRQILNSLVIILGSEFPMFMRDSKGTQKEEPCQATSSLLSGQCLEDSSSISFFVTGWQFSWRPAMKNL